MEPEQVRPGWRVRLACWLLGHDWQVVSARGDWLEGGTNVYRCARPGCGRRLTATRWNV